MQFLQLRNSLPDSSVSGQPCTCAFSIYRRPLTALNSQSYWTNSSQSVLMGRHGDLSETGMRVGSLLYILIGCLLHLSLERGVRQGSILSPTLFNIIMKPLLLILEASHLGLSMNNLYGGTYLHTDDIRTLATSASTLQAQISDVLKFTSNNFLQINPAKNEIVSFAQRNSVDDPVCEIEEKLLPASGTAKCLGHLWNHNLSAKPSIEHNVLKARKSFFAYGSMGLFKGDLSPLSGRSMVETCILPILLYGIENRCLTQNSIQMLDSFLGELSKRLLRLPRWYSNTPASIVVGLMSARALCLTRKLNFLRKISIDEYSETMSSWTLRCLSDDLDSICLIRECRDLDRFFHSDFTSTML